MVARLARMLDAGVLVLDGPSAGAVPDAERVRRRVAEREFEEDGWHVVTVPIPPSGWLAVTARRRVPLARAAAAAAVPLLAATERLAELAREQERAVRAALLDELLELTPGAETRGLAARAASFGVTFPARVVVGEQGRLVTRHNGRWVALVDGRRSRGRSARIHGRREASRGPTATPSSRTSAGSRPTRRSTCRRCCWPTRTPSSCVRAWTRCWTRCPRRCWTALKEFFARDQDVNAAAAALHVHPNTLRYRLGRVEALLGRSLRSPATIAELMLALSTRAS